MDDGDNTSGKHRGLLAPWRPGQSGNPRGRPKGSRSKIQESFLSDFYEAWQLFGPIALIRMAEGHPDKFVQVAASLLPKEVKLTEMTDDELRERIDALAADCGLGIVEPVGRDEAPQEQGPVRH